MNLLEHLRAKASEAIFDMVESTSDSTLTGKTAEHYRQGKGEPLKIDPEEIKHSNIVVDATKRNEERLLESFKNDKNLYKKLPDGTLQKITLSEIKNHERVVLQDYFDADHDRVSTLLKNPDIGLSLGSFKLRSKSNLEFEKSGQKILPYGHVIHSIHDTYDFNKGSPYRIITNPLEKSKGATPYDASSSWISRPLGVIHINEEGIDTTGVEWH